MTQGREENTMTTQPYWSSPNEFRYSRTLFVRSYWSSLDKLGCDRTLMVGGLSEKRCANTGALWKNSGTVDFL